MFYKLSWNTSVLKLSFTWTIDCNFISKQVIFSSTECVSLFNSVFSEKITKFSILTDHLKAVVLTVFKLHMSRRMTKPTKWHVRPANTHISLDIRPVWPESSLSAWRNLGPLATHWTHSEDSEQTWRMPRLIWVFALRTCHFVGFVVQRLIWVCGFLLWGLFRIVSCAWHIIVAFVYIWHGDHLVGEEKVDLLFVFHFVWRTYILCFLVLVVPFVGYGLEL